MEDAYQKYKNARHEAYAARRNILDDYAFKTSERYDQWVLTLSGGALAISLTFLEKIAPEPAANTLILLGLSWLTYILSVLAGFCAIYFSREAIYRQIEIGDEVYNQFRKTTANTNPEGEILPLAKNRHNKTISILNGISITCLVLGTSLMCWFALANIGGAKPEKKKQIIPQINVSVNLPQMSTNVSLTTNTAINNTNKPKR